MYLYDPVQGHSPGALVARLLIRLSGFRGSGGEGDEAFVQRIADALGTILKPRVSRRAQLTRARKGFICSRAITEIMEQGVDVDWVHTAVAPHLFQLSSVLMPTSRAQLLDDAVEDMRSYLPKYLDTCGVEVLRRNVGQLFGQQGVVKAMPLCSDVALKEKRGKARSVLKAAEQKWLAKLAQTSMVGEGDLSSSESSSHE